MYQTIIFLKIQRLWNLSFYLPKKYNEQGALNDSHIYFEGLSVHHLRKCVLYLAYLQSRTPGTDGFEIGDQEVKEEPVWAVLVQSWHSILAMKACGEPR